MNCVNVLTGAKIRPIHTVQLSTSSFLQFGIVVLE